jgi:hypothetical protein
LTVEEVPAQARDRKGNRALSLDGSDTVNRVVILPS